MHKEIPMSDFIPELKTILAMSIGKDYAHYLSNKDLMCMFFALGGVGAAGVLVLPPAGPRAPGGGG